MYMLYNAICIYSNGIVISLLGGKLKERGSVKRGKGVRARNKATIGNAQAERSAAEPCENRDAQAKGLQRSSKQPQNLGNET